VRRRITNSLHGARVSEITESNGSSSMASVCGASLALMDAGVPLSGQRRVSPWASFWKFAALRCCRTSRRRGSSRRHDFKVAGTDQGITSLQMDTRSRGITEEIMKVALGQAKEGRIHILGEMSKA